jgi:hypothetical protein
MTSALPVTDTRTENYLRRLATALRGMPEAEKKDVLREIRAHIVDSVAGAADDDAAITRVLHFLGTPEDLARRYDAERLLARAGRSFSPVLLLHTTWSWAKLGMKGTLAFFAALIGYSLAFALTLSALLKPIMPSHIGMWWGHGNLNIGYAQHPERMQELLGQWFVPVVVVAAFVFAVGTTQALRWLIRKRVPNPTY